MIDLSTITFRQIEPILSRSSLEEANPHEERRCGEAKTPRGRSQKEVKTHWGRLLEGGEKHHENAFGVLVARRRSGQEIGQLLDYWSID